MTPATKDAPSAIDIAAFTSHGVGWNMTTSQEWLNQSVQDQSHAHQHSQAQRGQEEHQEGQQGVSHGGVTESSG